MISTCLAWGIGTHQFVVPFFKDNGKERPIFRDIRQYFCKFYGICRSKKALISSHILAHHKNEMDTKSEEYEKTEGVKESNTCENCGLAFKKPAYSKQHM